MGTRLKKVTSGREVLALNIFTQGFASLADGRVSSRKDS